MTGVAHERDARPAGSLRSVAVGGLCAVIVAAAGWIATKGNPNWQRFGFFVVVAFFVPWSLTQIIGWVVEGFSRARKSN
jgi:hypothetical protein